MVYYNTEVQCPTSYQKKGFCISYFFKVFNEYPSVHSIKKKDYLEEIKKIHDPILKYVALYLYRNYVIASDYFNNNSNKNNNDACSVFSRWLDQEKNFYTNIGTCYYNRHWWNIYIEPLLKKLESYYPGKTCERFYPHYDPSKILDYQDEKYKLYELMPEDYVCYKEYKRENNEENIDNSIKENCAKLSVLFDLCEKNSLFNQNLGENSNITYNNYCPKYGGYSEKINYSPVLKAEKLCFCDSLISTIALPITITVLGTIFLVFF